MPPTEGIKLVGNQITTPDQELRSVLMQHLKQSGEAITHHDREVRRMQSIHAACRAALEQLEGPEDRAEGDVGW